MLKKIVLLTALYLPASCLTAAPPGLVGEEIRHLLAYLGESGCQFLRNGDWHTASEARSHLEKKHHYLLRKGLAGTAEQFIERAATASSVSGHPYQVKCPGHPAQASADWLGAELQRYRRRGEPAKP